MVSGQSSRRAALAEINVTPLVDVMLVLLIIFMITAPMLQHEVEVNLPEVTNKPRTPSEEQLVLTITKEGSVFLNRTAYTLEALRPHLQVLSQAQPDQEMFLRADAEVPYGRVVQVMDAVKKAGILRLGMITQPEPGYAMKAVHVSPQPGHAGQTLFATSFGVSLLIHGLVIGWMLSGSGSARSLLSDAPSFHTVSLVDAPVIEPQAIAEPAAIPEAATAAPVRNVVPETVVPPPQAKQATEAPEASVEPPAPVAAPAAIEAPERRPAVENPDQETRTRQGVCQEAGANRNGRQKAHTVGAQGCCGAAHGGTDTQGDRQA